MQIKGDPMGLQNAGQKQGSIPKALKKHSYLEIGGKINSQINMCL